MRRIEWHNLYGGSWRDEIVPEAYSHPAKYNRDVIFVVKRGTRAHFP